MARPLAAVMASSLALLALVALLAAGSEACTLPPRGCSAAKCALINSNSYGKTPPFFIPANKTGDKNVGWWYGFWNNATGKPSNFSSRIDAPILNFEPVRNIGVNEEAGFLIEAAAGVANISSCCTRCAKTSGCQVYLWYESGNYTKCRKGSYSNSYAYATERPNGWVDGVQCYLLSGGSDTEVGEPGYNITAPYTGTHSYQVNINSYTTSGTYNFPPAWIGGRCNPGVNITDDPHFVGKYGTRYDFNGEIDKSFMLISDERLHVNIRLGGYEDTRTYGATKLKNGKAIRTWIKEIGMLWVDTDSKTHTLHMTARGGKDEAIGAGYMRSLSVDGEERPALEVGQETQSGSLTLRRLAVEKLGPYSMDTFSLEIQGLLKLRLQMRPAHPLLQTATDAQIHFNLHIDSIEASPKVHGVLGQTFRKTNTQLLRALEYQMLTKLLGHPVAADGESGLGFLDGQPQDYIVPGILSTNCKFSSFQ